VGSGYRLDEGYGYSAPNGLFVTLTQKIM
jgi:hypothetical protein